MFILYCRSLFRVVKMQFFRLALGWHIRGPAKRVIQQLDNMQVTPRLVIKPSLWSLAMQSLTLLLAMLA